MKRLLTVSLLLMLAIGYTSAQPGSDTLILYFAGDVMQHKAQLDAAFNQESGTYSYAGCLDALYPEIREAEIAVCNLETTLGGAPYSGYPAFCSPDALASALKEAGFDICLTANNHCLDRGARGLQRTLDVLDTLGLYHLGTYRDPQERESHHPYIISWRQHKIALLNYTYDTNGITVNPPSVVNYIDTTQIASDIKLAKALHADCIIACMHWGTEYRMAPDQSQKAMERWLYGHGVSHIIGGHPHVVQPVEERKTKGHAEPGLMTRADSTDVHLTVWSLGNYLSNMSAKNTDHGLAVTLYFVNDKSGLRLARYRLHPNRTLRHESFRVVPDEAAQDSRHQ